MPTLATLAQDGKLVKYEADLERDEMPHRFVYLAPAALDWFENDLPAALPDRSRDLTPREQVEQILYEFIVGSGLVYERSYKKLDPLANHVWELKTEDVRIIGWFPRKATYLVCRVRMKRDLPRFRCYSDCISETVQFRDLLDLDPPKLITGVRADAVL